MGVSGVFGAFTISIVGTKANKTLAIDDVSEEFELK